MSNRKVVVPTVTWSPGLSRVEETRRPFTLMPLVEPRSAICPVAGRRAAQLGVAAGDVGVGEHALGLLRAADRRPRPVEHVAAVVERDDGAGGDQRFGRAARVFGAAAVALVHRRVDHRVALLALLRRLALVRRRLDQPGLDPELAEAQALVGLELDRGPGQQVVAAAAGVLEQVAGELLLERALVAFELDPVLLGEVDGVLVGHVDAGHRRRSCGRPSPWPACGRARPAAPRS